MQVQTASPDVTSQVPGRERLRLHIPPPLPQEPCDISSLGEVWPRVRVSVMEAVALGGGTHTEEDVIDLLVFGRAFLWANGDSGVLCEFDDFPRKRVCRFWSADTIVSWARANGAQRMDIVGRAGWLKVLPGYKRGGVWMTKDLGDDPR